MGIEKRVDMVAQDRNVRHFLSIHIRPTLEDLKLAGNCRKQFEATVGLREFTGLPALYPFPDDVVGSLLERELSLPLDVFWRAIQLEALTITPGPDQRLAGTHARIGIPGFADAPRPHADPI